MIKQCKAHIIYLCVTIALIGLIYSFYDTNIGYIDHVSEIVSTKYLHERELEQYKLVSEIDLSDISSNATDFEEFFATPILSEHSFASEKIAIVYECPEGYEREDLSLNLQSVEFWDENKKVYYDYIWRGGVRTTIIYSLKIARDIPTTIGLPNDVFDSYAELSDLQGVLRIYEQAEGV